MLNTLIFEWWDKYKFLNWQRNESVFMFQCKVMAFIDIVNAWCVFATRRWSIVFSTGDGCYCNWNVLWNTMRIRIYWICRRNTHLFGLVGELQIKVNKYQCVKISLFFWQRCTVSLSMYFPKEEHFLRSFCSKRIQREKSASWPTCYGCSCTLYVIRYMECTLMLDGNICLSIHIANYSSLVGTTSS